MVEVVLEDETDHLYGCVWTEWICIRLLRLV